MELDGEYTYNYSSSEASAYAGDYEATDSDACHKSGVIRFGATVTPVFFAVVVVLSCVGNALVLWVLIKYENLKSLTNAFLLNLAISDLVFTFGLPFWAADLVFGWIFGTVVCKAVSFIFYLGFYSSLLFLTFMSVHRYMAVVHPLSVLWSRTPCRSVRISISIWLVSFCAAIPHLMFNTTVSGDGGAFCSFIGNVAWKCVSVYMQNLFFLAAFIAIAFCYVGILGRLLRPMSHSRPKTVKLILCIVMAFYLGWAPYNVSIFLDSLITFGISPFYECRVSTLLDYVFSVSRLLAFSHCCLNPLFYVFMGVKFREHLKKALMNCRRGEQHPERRHSHVVYSNGEEVSMY